MKISKTLSVILGSWLALNAVNSSAATFGQPDGDDHPYVGTLLFVQNGVGFFSCTGTLITPTVVLTAGHCVEGNGSVNDLTYVRFEENALAGINDYTSLQDWFDAEWILADSVVPHPDFDDYSAFPETYDIGLVILSEPVTDRGYGALPGVGELDAVLAAPGNQSNRFTVVGYGQQGEINPFFGNDYARYNGSTRLIELRSFNNGPGSSAKFTNNPGNVSGGSCFGDSGGPVLLRDTNIVTAVVSFGITPCIGVDFQYRVDTENSLNFINDNLD